MKPIWGYKVDLLGQLSIQVVRLAVGGVATLACCCISLLAVKELNFSIICRYSK